jgi:hypothetical protein
VVPALFGGFLAVLMGDARHFIDVKILVKAHSADLTMVALTLLRTGRVTLAETIELEGHRTPTDTLGSSMIGAIRKPMDDERYPCWS